MVTRSVIIGCGSYLPKRVVTNEDLTAWVDTSDEWIRQRTGISQRHMAAEGELTSDLAYHAAMDAMSKAGVMADEIDMVIVATTTPDRTFPATATTVQAKLGMTRGVAFDIQAACSGFIYAMSLADNFLRLGQAKTVIIIGAEIFSRIVDWNDRGSCVLFGDGAGAVVLRAEQGQGTKEDRGVLSTHIHSDGRDQHLLWASGGPAFNKQVGVVQMEGKEVFRHAVTHLSEVVDEALTANKMQPSELDWLVPHQANRRIIDATAKKLSMPTEKVILTVDRHANTSAASVPLALAQGVNDGRVKKGDMVLMEAMGAGFTWGAAVVRM